MLKWSCHLQNKIELRNYLRTLRHAKTPEQQSAAAHAAATIFARHSIFLNSQHIAIYLARSDEFPTMPIIEKIWQVHKNCYLPCLSSEKENFLKFVEYSSQDDLQPNRYNILEPKNTKQRAAEQLDVVLMPLVGFDLKGHRLGMGGGYYDRTFAFLLKQSRPQKTLLIGLAYEEQCVAEVPHDVWDVALDGVLTEKKLLMF